MHQPAGEVEPSLLPLRTTSTAETPSFVLLRASTMASASSSKAANPVLVVDGGHVHGGRSQAPNNLGLGARERCQRQPPDETASDVKRATFFL